MKKWKQKNDEIEIEVIDKAKRQKGSDGELFPNMNTRVPSEPILLLTHEFEKLSIH